MFRQQRRNRGSTPSPVLIGLVIQILSQLERSPYKPPVTILLLFVNIFVHVSPYPTFLGYDLTSTSQNCIFPSKIISSIFKSKSFPLNRVVLSSIIHVDDMHLYYNMLSLCWKGVQLESHMGSAQFLQLIIFSVLVAHTMLVAIAYWLDSFGLDSSLSGYHSCAVGFSAVLFSLKYVWNYHVSSTNQGVMSQVMFLSVPLRYAAWLELVLISLITPNVSFMGHLCGILAGMLWVHGLSVRRLLPDSIVNAVSSLFTLHDRAGNDTRTRYTYASGTATSSNNVSRNTHNTSSGSNNTHIYNSNTNMDNAEHNRFELELESVDDINIAETASERTERERRNRLRRFDDARSRNI